MTTLTTRSQTTEMTRVRQAWNFVRHYLEMCIAMCVGIAIGDVIYVAVAGAAGFADPFGQLPVLSLVVVTFSMTAPMVAWMRFRGMDWWLVNEMTASMVVLAILILAGGLLGLVPMGELARVEHLLMMPAMLVPMLLRVDEYTGRSGRMAHMGHAG
jgi:hypothetical protein